MDMKKIYEEICKYEINKQFMEKTGLDDYTKWIDVEECFWGWRVTHSDGVMNLVKR